MSAPLLEVENLRVSFPSPTGRVEVVRGISFTLGRERLGIVGESGSGKSMTGRAILRLIRKPGRQSADRMVFNGIELQSLSDRRMRALRGARISMVMQDPPVHTTFRRLVAKGFTPRQVTAVEPKVREFVVDQERKVISTPAYMLANNIVEAADGIEKTVKQLLAL